MWKLWILIWNYSELYYCLLAFFFAMVATFTDFSDTVFIYAFFLRYPIPHFILASPIILSSQIHFLLLIQCDISVSLNYLNQALSHTFWDGMCRQFLPFPQFVIVVIFCPYRLCKSTSLGLASSLLCPNIVSAVCTVEFCPVC